MRCHAEVLFAFAPAGAGADRVVRPYNEHRDPDVLSLAEGGLGTGVRIATSGFALLAMTGEGAKIVQKRENV